MQFDRLEALMKQQGKSKKHMGEIVGKGGYYIKNCKAKGIRVPEEIIRAWAHDLDTTCEYLTGRTDDPRSDREKSEEGNAGSGFAALFEQIAGKETAAEDLAELEKFMKYLIKRG